MLTPEQWQAYKNTINAAHNSFNQDTVMWYRFVRGFQRYGEDTLINEHFNTVSLKCLIEYNAFRTWPVTDETLTGILDKESMVMILNKKYLSDNGYLNSDGFFNFNPGRDKFTHLGLEYRSAGEVPVAQAGDEPLLFYIILKRQEKSTGDIIIMDEDDTAPIAIQYRYYTDGIGNYREGMRNDHFVRDKAITPTGFMGIEGIDWENTFIE